MSYYLAKIDELVNDQGSRLNIANKTAIMDMTQNANNTAILLKIVQTLSVAPIALGLMTKQYTKKDNSDFQPVCALCKHFKKPSDQASGSSQCPMYKIQFENLVSRSNHR